MIYEKVNPFVFEDVPEGGSEEGEGEKTGEDKEDKESEDEEV